MERSPAKDRRPNHRATPLTKKDRRMMPEEQFQTLHS